MSLNLLQKKLLKLWTLNARYASKDIAKALNISDDTVHYHYKKLIEEEGYGIPYVQFNYALIGYAHYHYLVRLKDPQKISREALIALNGCTFINLSHGKYDLQFIVVAKDEEELARNIHAINTLLRDNIQETSQCKFLKMYKYRHIIPSVDIDVALPTNKKNPIYSYVKENFAHNKKGNKELDQVDKDIISALLAHPRESYLELSRTIGISHETIRRRILSYLSTGFIQAFAVSPNYKKYGFFPNYILLRIADVDDTAIKQLCEEKNYIFYCAKLLGQYTLIMYLVSKTPEEFGKQVQEIRSALSTDVLDIELLYFDDVLKNKQMPEQALI